MSGDVNKFYKKLEKETKRAFSDVGDFAWKISGGQELSRAPKNVSSMFAPTINIPPTPVVESVTRISEYADDTRKKRVRPTGRSTSMLAGVSNALKKRLGE